MGAVPIRNKSFQTADGHGLSLNAAGTVGFTLAFLCTDASCCTGHVIFCVNKLVGLFKCSGTNSLNKLWDGDPGGTEIDAIGTGAIQTACRLLDRFLRGIA